MGHMAVTGEHISLYFGNNTASLSWSSGGHFVCLMTAILVYRLSKIMFASHRGVYMKILHVVREIRKKSKTTSLPKYFCTAVLYKVWTNHTKFICQIKFHFPFCVFQFFLFFTLFLLLFEIICITFGCSFDKLISLVKK